MHSPAELERCLERTSALGLEMLLTEMVPGPDRYQSAYAYIDHDGRVLFSFSKQKLRQWPVRFGGGCYHLTDHDPEVIELALRFLRGAGVRGLANVEFKRDYRDGHLKLIEVQSPHDGGRPASSDAAGLDLPMFLYTRVVGLPEPAMDSYRQGLALWYPFYDFRAARAYRRAGGSVRAMVAQPAAPPALPLADWDDPGPMLAALRARVTGVCRRIRRAGRPTVRPAPRREELRRS